MPPRPTTPPPTRPAGPPAAALALAAAVALAPWIRGSLARADAGPSFRVEPAEVRAERGMVSAENLDAARAGAELLAAGGNAVDAAVATAFAIGVTSPSSAGLGGGGFLLLHEARTGTVHALDFRERAPAAATRDMFVEAGPASSVRGGLAVGVPGEVHGLLAALERFGTKPRSEVLAPAIRLASEGIRVSGHLAAAIARHAETFREDPDVARVFLDGSGRPLVEGATLRQPALAATLRAIAERGGEPFVRGSIARSIVAEVKAARGLLASEDLRAYEVVWRRPVSTEYRGHQVFGFPPPSSGGGVLLAILEVIEPWDPGVARTSPDVHLHRLAEAERLAFADRAIHYGDPDFVDVPVTELVSPRHTAKLRARIDPERAGDSGDGPVPLERHGTSHLSTIDAAGNAVALTHTVNTAFGSKVYVGEAGIFLNNEMDDFAAAPGVPNVYGLVGTEANAVHPGKRPLSSMSPTIVLRGGRPRLALGGSGGPRIITATLSVLLGVIDHGLPLVRAVAAPRIHHQWKPDRLWHEPGFDPGTLLRLRSRGHRLEATSGLAAVQAVAVEDGAFVGVADPRKGGGAAGW